MRNYLKGISIFYVLTLVVVFFVDQFLFEKISIYTVFIYVVYVLLIRQFSDTNYLLDKNFYFISAFFLVLLNLFSIFI